METLKNKTVFKCSYCTRVSLSSVGIYQHERYCSRFNKTVDKETCKRLEYLLN